VEVAEAACIDFACRCEQEPAKVRLPSAKADDVLVHEDIVTKGLVRTRQDNFDADDGGEMHDRVVVCRKVVKRCRLHEIQREAPNAAVTLQSLDAGVISSARKIVEDVDLASFIRQRGGEPS